MKVLVLTALTLCSIANIFGQRVHGKMNAKLRSDIKMNLARIEGGEIIDVKSTEIKPSGIFDFEDVNQPTGLYVLYTTQKSNNFEFIIHNESELKFNIIDSGFKNVGVQLSKENKLYSKYLSTKLKKDIKLNSLQKKLNNPALSESEKGKINNQISFLNKAFLAQTNEQLNASPKSFFSQLINAQFADNVTDKNKYFSDLDFNNENLLRTRVYPERFREYIIRFSKGEKYGFMDCIDDIMNKTKVNQKVYEFAAYNMMDGFYNSGMEDLSNYILDEYIFAEACGGMKVGEMLKNRGQALKNLQVGNKPSNIILSDLLKKKQNLYTTVSKNKYTLVMFWSSTCHACESQIPIAKSVYSEYKAKGLEIFGVSFDLHQSAWRKALIDNKLNWINVCDFKAWDSPVSKSYKVVKTPTYFLLDTSGKIVSKPRNINEVSAILNKLKQNGGF